MSSPTVTDPVPTGPELAQLGDFLRLQRELVAWKLAGAKEADLRRVATPSGLTPLGIVRHLTETERYWFRHVFADEPDLLFSWTEEDPDGEFRIGKDDGLPALLAAYAAEWARSDAIVARAASLDRVSARRGFSLRWIVLHMIEETARHLGHLDLLREQADGAVGCDPL